MKSMKLPVRILCAAALPFALMTVPVGASDPLGAYCVVDKVVLEPAADKAERVQLWGTCALANTNDWYFQAPANGYFYFSAPVGQEATARAEWADLKSVAGTTQAVGFARRYKPVGRFRSATEKPSAPDTYPIHIGVMKVGTRVVPEVREVVQKIQTLHGR
jgi:hypothetical protein